MRRTSRIGLFACLWMSSFSSLFGVVASNDAITWIQQAAIPFSTTAVSENLLDVECLRNLVGKARVVGLGEQTHGTSEFQTMKHRIIQFLVEEMGFNAVILEASWGGGLVADRYVTEGAGSYPGTANALAFWFFRSREFCDAISWMRSHNTTTASPPIHLVGMDYASPHKTLSWCASLLSSVGISLDSTTNGSIDRLAALSAKLYSGTPAQRQAYFDRFRAVMDDIILLLPNENSPIPELQQEEIRFIPRILDQLEGRLALDTSDPAALFDYRDRCMAENVSWWLDALGDEAKVIVWAHNGHVGTDWAAAQLTPMGQSLRQEFGDDYIAFGFSTCSGTFSAYSTRTGELEKFTLPPAEEGSYESMLCQTEIPLAFIDLRELTPDSAAEAWLSRPHTFKSFGNSAEMVDGLVAYAYYWQCQLPNMFDVLIHIQQTSGLR